MKIRFNIWVIFIAAIIGLIGLADAQTAKPGEIKTITLETGEVVPDLTGEWDAAVENFGRGFRGPTTNVLKITQEGNMFKAVRLQDEAKRAKGTMFMQGELDKDGFKSVYFVDFAARLLPCTGKIGEGGKEIKIDEGFSVRATLTRR